MFKMILADDEPVITREIQKLVDWEKLGIEIVGEYQDGAQALHGLISLKPDFALLNISMPKKTGLDILKEIKTIGLETQIIFISDFQEFEYVREALAFGAVNYILKPIKKEQLISTIENCIAFSSVNSKIDDYSKSEVLEEKEDFPANAYELLLEIEQTTYQPVAIEILYPPKIDLLEKRSIKLSVFSYIQTYLQRFNAGIVFYKNNNIVVVLKGRSEKGSRHLIFDMIEGVYFQTKNRIGAVIGDVVSDIGLIWKAYQETLTEREYFFFSHEMKYPIIRLGEPIFYKGYTIRDLMQCRQKLMDAIFSQDRSILEAESRRFKKILGNISDGKRENASFHFCSAICCIEEQFQQMGMTGLGVDMKTLLEKGRGAESFLEMAELYKEYFDIYIDLVGNSVQNNDKKYIMKAINYIEAHYKENISLEVLADYIHMDSYYFSNFFKKQTGENFKNYLNQVRMKKAVALLLSTDMKNYEIVEEVGFQNTRYFAELFQRYYGETPSSYRKRLKSEE